MDATSASVVGAYENRIAELERQKLLLDEKRTAVVKPRGTFEELFELAFGFLANPWKLWVSGRYEHRSLVLRLAFSERLAYCVNSGFRTPKTTLPFNAIGALSMPGSKMAERMGFEPTRPFWSLLP